MDKETIDTLSKSDFISPLRYISGRIIEYDIKSANISILYDKRKIDKDYFLYLSNTPKNIREKEIGLLIRKDSSYYDIIEKGIREYRLKFGEANNINFTQISRISHDALFINTSVDLPYTNFGNIIFKVKSISNVMINFSIAKIIVFVSFNNDSINIDVKGISTKLIDLHSNYMLNIIATTVYYVERSSIEDALSYLSNIIDDYINRKLDIGFYREFNASSGYRIVSNDITYILSNIKELDDSIIIDYNLIILRELWSIILEIYNRKKR